MNKKLLIEIRQKAEALPVFKIAGPEIVKYTGRQLMNKGVYKIDGDAVEEHKTYTKHKLVDVNHYNTLKDIFRKEGMAGVDHYCKKIMEHFGALQVFPPVGVN